MEEEYVKTLKKNYDYWHITEEEYNTIKNKLGPKYKFNDIIWAILNLKVSSCELAKDYSSLRNYLLAQAQFLEKEKKNPLYLYVEIILYDICLEYKLINSLKQFKQGNYKKDNRPFINKIMAKKVYKYRINIDKINLKNIYQNNTMEKPISYSEYENLINKIVNNEVDIDTYNKFLTDLFQ